MQCPKCGESSEGTVICPGCDYILDSSFLGTDFLNEASQHDTGSISSGSDAIVFGGIDEPVDLMFSESTGSFLTADTRDVDRHIVRAPVYVGRSVQELMKAEAVLAPAADIDKRKSMLSAFELHVLASIDGKRPVARLRKTTGLSSDDLRIAVGMLAEKKAVVLVGTVAPPGLGRLLAGELDSDDDGAFDEATLEATVEDMILPMRATSDEPTTNKSRELPKFKLDTMDLPDEHSAKSPPSPWEGAKKERGAGFFELAQMELGNGNRVRAHVYAKLAVEADPGEARYRELLQSWSAAPREATTLEAALFADADAAEKQGDNPKALALMEQALAANPNAAHIHNRIGLLLATRFKKLADASDHLMKACELEPTNVVYRNNLGKIIALADARSERPMSKQGKGFLGKLKKALE